MYVCVHDRPDLTCLRILASGSGGDGHPVLRPPGGGRGRGRAVAGRFQGAGELDLIPIHTALQTNKHTYIHTYMHTVPGGESDGYDTVDAQDIFVRYCR